MKNLFFFTALILLIFSADTTLQAQECFNMSIAQGIGLTAPDKSCYEITLDNDRQNSVNVYDDKGQHSTTCSGNSTITFHWCYDAPPCGDVFEIICEANGTIDTSCFRDGCVIVIEPRKCPIGY